MAESPSDTGFTHPQITIGEVPPIERPEDLLSREEIIERQANLIVDAKINQASGDELASGEISDADNPLGVTPQYCYNEAAALFRQAGLTVEDLNGNGMVESEDLSATYAQFLRGIDDKNQNGHMEQDEVHDRLFQLYPGPKPSEPGQGR